MNRQELHDRLEAQARRLAALIAETHRPMWLSDTEPGHEAEDISSGTRLVAKVMALLAFAALLGFIGLACRAWVIEDDLAAKRTRETVAQMEGR